MTDEKNIQIGETVTNSLGWNLTQSFAIMQNIRAMIEQMKEAERIQSVLQQHMDGKVSALAVKYMDIVKVPEILDYVTPISREPDINGRIILWEGYQKDGGNFTDGMRGDRGPVHRVIQWPNGHRVFCKNVRGGWVVCEATDPKTKQKIPNRFPTPGFARPNNDDWKDVGGNTMQRTVMNSRGETVTRAFNGYKPRTVRR